MVCFPCASWFITCNLALNRPYSSGEREQQELCRLIGEYDLKQQVRVDEKLHEPAVNA